MLAALLLAALLDRDAVCEPYARGTYTPPAIARETAEKAHCDDDNPFCNVRLAEQFANAKGVARDYDVAQYFLCEAGYEIEDAAFDAMVTQLAKMRAGETTDALRYCDHISGGYPATYCANIAWEEAMPELDARIAAQRRIAKNNAAFEALERAGARFLKAESARISVQYKGGTGQMMFTLYAEIESKETYAANLERFANQRAPGATNDDARRADDDLNLAYRNYQKMIDDVAAGVPEWKPLLRDAQRAWIAYRDAFAAYYVERWRGSASADVLRREIVTELSKQRAAEIRKS